MKWLNNPNALRAWTPLGLVFCHPAPRKPAIAEVDKSESEQNTMSCRNGEARFRELARLAPVGMFLTDPAGEKVLVNERWCEITGLSEKDAQSLGWLRSVHPDDRERVEREIRRARAEGSEYSLEYRLLRLDGEATWVISKVARLSDSPGEPEAYIGVMMNVASQKEIENHLVEATRQMGEAIHFKIRAIRNLQHELRTPLNSIIGLSELLQDEMKHAKRSMYIQMIHESSLRLTQTIERIVRLSQVESSEFRPNMRKTDLSQLTRTVASRFVDSARMKGVEMGVDVEDKGPAALVDVEMLQQALSHVLDNALKFTSHGSIKIALQEIEEGQIKFAEISIVDTGIGIPKEYNEAVFEPFRQLSEGATRKYQGTGLGLTIARKIVEEMNGKITLYSEPLKGTRVVIRFPILPAA